MTLMLQMLQLGFLQFLLINYAKGQITCLRCATAELRFQWHVTGLPGKLPETSQFFTNDCRDVSTTEVQARIQKDENCMTYCMTYIIGQGVISGSSTPSIVRGCHERLTGITLRGQPTAWCESGNSPLYTEDGVPLIAASKPKEASFSVRFCNTANCNLDSSIRTGDSTLCPAQTNLVSPKCTTCVAKADNCASPNGQLDSCSAGSYCYKSVTISSGNVEVIKGCAVSNPYRENTCKTITSNAFIQTRALASIESTQCYCNTPDNCNGAIALAASSAFLALAVVAIVRIYFFL